jgi:hypothetical protein
MELIKASLMAAAMQGGGGGNLGSLSVTENGTYTPQSTGQSVDGWNSVAVSVPISPLTVNANGTYTATNGGYSPVTVDVPTYEQEYQEMQQCCSDVAAILQVDPTSEGCCDRVKQRVLNIVTGSSSPIADVDNYDPANATENLPMTYFTQDIESGNWVMFGVEWGTWTSVQSYASFWQSNRPMIIVTKYNAATGEITTSRTEFAYDYEANQKYIPSGSGYEPKSATECFQEVSDNNAFYCVLEGTRIHAGLHCWNHQGWPINQDLYFDIT